MFKRFLTCVAIAAACCSQSLPSQTFAATDAAIVAPATMSVAQLEEMLVDLGYEPVKTTSASGSVAYEVISNLGNQNVYLTVSYSPEQNQVKIVAHFRSKKDLKDCSGAELLQFLRLTGRRATSRFVLNSTGEVVLVETTDPGQIGPMTIRSTIDMVDEVVRLVEKELGNSSLQLANVSVVDASQRLAANR